MELQSLVSLLMMMGLVVLTFRLWVRRPRGVSGDDPPGIRTMVLFAGNAAEFFAEDRPDEMFVGVKLFRMMRDALHGRGIDVVESGTLQNAQCMICRVGADQVCLVLERLEDRWLLSCEWVPTCRAEQRHLNLTHQVFSPRDTAELRALLTALDQWLKRDDRFQQIAWHRRQDWVAQELNDPRDTPLDAG